MAVAMVTIAIAALLGVGDRGVVGSPDRVADRLDPCLPGTAVPIMDSPYVSQAKASHIVYNSEPPTSGPHFAVTAPPGIYTSTIPDGLAVHALSNGHIVIHYSPDLARVEVARLERVAKRFAEDLLLNPRGDLGTTVVLTAWGRLETLHEPDEQRIEQFVVALRERYDHGWHGAGC